MKKVTGLDEKPSTLEDIPKGVDIKIPSYRQMYKAAVGGMLGKSGDDAIEHYQLGLKLKLEGDVLELEDAEFKLLDAACLENPAKWTAHYHAQVILKLKEADKATPPKK